MSSTAEIKSRKNELTKSYYVWVAGNNTEIYEAPVLAVDGAPCLKTTYEYDGDNQIIKSKEEVTTWDSSYDI